MEATFTLNFEQEGSQINVNLYNPNVVEEEKMAFVERVAKLLGVIKEEQSLVATSPLSEEEIFGEDI